LTIWLLRHAESEWNAVGRGQGHGDPPLSANGRAEARARAPEVAVRVAAGPRGLRVFSSDLRRAVETASFVAAELEVEPVALASLRELDVGRWTGLTREEIAARDADVLAAFESDDPDARPGGGETRGEIRVRVRAEALRLADENPDCDLLLVVHLGVVRALIPGTEPGHLELCETDADAIRQVQARDARRR
jgi:broad specificity phosphatase PhoE